jgi:hypothetical protein
MGKVVAVNVTKVCGETTALDAVSNQLHTVTAASIHWRLDELQSPCGCFGGDISLLPMLGIKPQFLRHPANSLMRTTVELCIGRHV